MPMSCARDIRRPARTSVAPASLNCKLRATLHAPRLEVRSCRHSSLRFKTSKGDIRVNLMEDVAPLTVANFVNLVSARLLRWPHVPSRDRRFHDSRRLSARHRHRRPRLQVQRRVLVEGQTRRTGQAVDGERGPRQQWIAVLHHARAHAVARRQAHDLRCGAGCRRSGGRRQDREGRHHRDDHHRRRHRRSAWTKVADQIGKWNSVLDKA